MATRKTALKKAGRPTLKAAAKLTERIVLMATRIFLKDGYAASSMENIALSAGVSKRTLYSRFRRKEDLFHAAILAYSDTVIGKLSDRELDMPIQKRLYEVCLRILKAVLCDEGIEFSRLMIAEAGRFPELARDVDLGRQRVAKYLKEIIQTAIHNGELEMEDVELATSQLLSLVVAPAIRNAQLAISPLGVTEKVRKAAHDGVLLFLAGYSAEG